MMQRGRPYWATSQSHYYSEPKRLARLGYLSSRKTSGKTRERTHYELTEAGHTALQEWVARPTPFPRIQNEAAARLVAGPLAGDRSLLQSLHNLHRELDEASAGLDEAEAAMITFAPERQRYLRLVHRLGRRVLAAQREWLDEGERELDASRRSGPRGEVE